MLRVVGYIREAPGPQESDTAFSQSERIRRWVTEAGHQLVAVCQDIRHSGHALGRDGYKALVGIIGAGQVDAVVVASLNTLSLDMVVQEILIWDLRSRSVTILSAEPEDLDQLKEPPDDRSRLFVRDVLTRVAEHVVAASEVWAPSVVPVDATAEDVVVELIPPDDDTPQLSSS